jgi:hypothetical protein
VEPRPDLRDPDFDAPRPVEPLLVELDHSPESYQRLMANPFLGAFGFIAWIVALGWLLKVRDRFAPPVIPIVVVVMISALLLPPRLFHYHCLDCGATGRLWAWRRHVCHASAERRRLGRPRRWRWPSPPVQVLFWLWFLLYLLRMAWPAQ